MTSVTETNIEHFALSDKQKEYAASVLNENEEAPAKIQEIRKWIETHETLRAPKDDFTIQRFLRVCKYEVERAKTRMMNYYSQRSNLPEWFSNRDPMLPEMQELLKMGTLLPLKEVDEQGRIIILLRVSIHDPDKVPMTNFLKASLMILDLFLKDHLSASIYGVVAIFDMAGTTLGHGLQMTPHVIQRLVHAWQGCYPLRIQSLNFVNAPSHVNVVLNIFKKFMNKKIKARTHVHKGSSEEFFKTQVPQNLLPTEYGGTAGPIEQLIDYWKNYVEQNQMWLREEETHRVIK